jgi:hypothetical protein
LTAKGSAAPARLLPATSAQLIRKRKPRRQVGVAAIGENSTDALPHRDHAIDLFAHVHSGEAPFAVEHELFVVIGPQQVAPEKFVTAFGALAVVPNLKNHDVIGTAVGPVFGS